MGNSMSFKHVITAAANAYTITSPDGKITKDIKLVDACHGGRNMRDMILFLRDIGCEIKATHDLGDRGQGFIDQNAIYHNRSDAYIIAKKSGQAFNDDFTLPDNKLDSSCIRHFPEKTLWTDL